MVNTELENILDQGIQYDEYNESKTGKVIFPPIVVDQKRKRILSDKMKAIGEEALCWLFIASSITALILFFSTL